MNGYNFTERVRKVLNLAREEAVRLHHDYVGPEHLLLGILCEGHGVALTVLTNLALIPSEVSSRVYGRIKKGRDSHVSGPNFPYTAHAKTALQMSMFQARDLNHSYVGTEHLLLGIIFEGKSVTAQLLCEMSGKTPKELLELARRETDTLVKAQAAH